jgi:hypothetical protein
MFDAVVPDHRDEPNHYLFHIDAAAADDALVRVLGPFVAVAATLKSVRMRHAGDEVSVSVEAASLDAQRAQTILDRLRNMPVVRRVSFGWRNAAAAQAYVGHH